MKKKPATTRSSTPAKASSQPTNPKALEFDLDNAFGFLIRRLNSLAAALFAQLSGQTELSGMQMGILLAVYQADLISLRGLSRRMHIDRSTIQEVVGRMVSRGLLRRRVPEHDRRTHELWLTPEGIEQVHQHLGAMAKLQGKLFEGIPPGDVEITLRCMHAILRHHHNA